MEKSLIVGLFETGKREYEIGQIMAEMKLLTESAGGEVVDSIYQKREAPDKRYLIGRGKAEEIQNAIGPRRIDVVIFYNHLNNYQQRNLENFFQVKVIDRGRLILDVFATRARSLEGKLQVELAQLLYLLPRLTGKGIVLSRLGGGIGTRGPGETRLEVDRRRIKKRISVIEKKLAKVIKNRDIQRKNRKLYPVPVVSLVGYTSAGKSTLFKSLTGEDVFISKQLFSTLDPLLRRVELTEIEEGYYFLLSDTVGFIREMPSELFRSFKATLEEVVQSDIILHVVDISNPDHLIQEREVQKVLEEIGIPANKIVTVYNKIDLWENQNPPPPEEPPAVENPHHGADTPGPGDGDRRRGIYVSAKENTGIPGLKRAIFEKYFTGYGRYTVGISPGVINLDSLGRWAIILNKRQGTETVDVEILCSEEKMLKFKEKYGGLVK